MLIQYEEVTNEILGGFSTLKRPRGNPRGNKKTYVDCLFAFDIETATNKALQVNYMYVWQFQIGTRYTIIGRTWEDYYDLCCRLSASIGKDTAVIYVHNLSYEFQYLKGIYAFGEHDVFASSDRRIIKCTALGNLEYRCSMMLSNMSLAQFTSSMGVEHVKLEGKDIYDKEYYPWSILPSHVLEYASYDVIGLVEAVQALMDLNGDDLYTVPLTSTGYPRRDMKAAMRYYPRRLIQRTLPPLPVYRLLEEGFRGGDVHANRYYAGRILSEETCGSRVRSADRDSSYPDVLCNKPYPMGEWKEEECTGNNLRRLMTEGERAVIARLRFWNVTLSDPWNGDPYIPRDKCSYVRRGQFDNGRVLAADELIIVCTDIDYYIITKDYRFSEVEVLEMYSSEYDFLPEPFVKVVCDYYVQKTALKHSGRDMEYAKAKSRLNGIYGMTATKVLRAEYVFRDGQLVPDTSTSDEEALSKAYKNAWSSYAWSVFCTSWSRYELWQGIQNVGHANFVYCDTDSVKYLDAPFITWDSYNQEHMEQSVLSGSMAYDSKGNPHYMGVYDDEGSYARFRTLGSKRYAYEDDDGKLHITVSGVAKKAGAKELGTLDRFEDGFMFMHSGKTASKYVDKPAMDYLYLKDDDGKSRQIRIVPYILIEETTYELSLSEEYRNLLELIEK